MEASVPLPPSRRTSWRVRLFSGRGLDYHLWMKGASDLFRQHHDDACCCDVGEYDDSDRAKLLNLDPGCHDVVDSMSHTVGFRSAHRVVERGLLEGGADWSCGGRFDARTSVVNLGGGAGGEKADWAEGPYGDVPGGHPAGGARLRMFTVQGGNVQERGPMWGNLRFTARCALCHFCRFCCCRCWCYCRCFCSCCCSC